MTFLTFVGGVVVFGLLWLVVPRASFVATLSMLLTKCYEVKLFANESASSNGWDSTATMLIILGFLVGTFLDFSEHFNTVKGRG